MAAVADAPPLSPGRCRSAGTRLRPALSTRTQSALCATEPAAPAWRRCKQHTATHSRQQQQIPLSPKSAANRLAAIRRAVGVSADAARRAAADAAARTLPLLGGAAAAPDGAAAAADARPPRSAAARLRRARACVRACGCVGVSRGGGVRGRES
eukprot:4729966-Pleurochrysis_carterae.AAC.1